MIIRASKKTWPVIIFLAISVFLFSACENPFDPLSQTSEIKGLSYIDFSGSWERWDSDPEYDGYIITLEYYNEFGDSLEFKEKKHTVIIEFYTQRTVGGAIDDEGNATGGTTTYDRLIWSYTVEFENTDDDIRIAKELYESALRGAGYDLESETAQVFIIVRVYPPKGKPQNEIQVGYSDMGVYEPTITDVTPNP